MSRTLQGTLRTLRCVNHFQKEEINKLFSVVFGHMKQDRLIFNFVLNETGWHFMY